MECRHGPWRRRRRAPSSAWPTTATSSRSRTSGAASAPRGRSSSSGPRDASDSKSTDETTDAYDTIDWLIKNVAGNNGRVGIWGISYPGWLTVQALLEPHPALRAASPQASPGDQFLCDDEHHNGAFRLSPVFQYLAVMGRAKEFTPFDYGRRDLYEWFLDLGPLSNVDTRHFQGKVSAWNDAVEHPDYDRYWRSGHCPRAWAAPACRRSTWWAGGTRRTSPVRSGSTRPSRSRTATA